MTPEHRQLVILKKGDRDKICQKLLASKSDECLRPFFDLSTIIDTAHVMLPAKLKPILKRFSTSYSRLSRKMEDVLNRTCTASSRFAIKSMEVLEHGRKKDHDQVLLIGLRNTLYSKHGKELLTIFNKAREDLVDIHSILLIEASGNQLQHLLDKSVATKKQLQQRSNNLTAKALKIDQNQRQICSLQQKLKTCTAAIKKSNEAKDSTRIEIGILMAEKSRYEAELNGLKHKISNLHPGHSLKSAILYPLICDALNNQQRIARENISRLHERLNDLNTKLRNWSIENFEKEESKARIKLSILTKQHKVLNRQYKNLQTAFNTTQEEYNKTLKEIQDIYRNSGTRDVKSIKMVDTLACSIQVASESLVKTYGKIKTHLEMIDTDPDMLIDSITNALDIISIGNKTQS